MRFQPALVCLVIGAGTLCGGLTIRGCESDAKAALLAPEARSAPTLLKDSADAIAKVKALSYRARAFSEGPLAAGTPVHDAMVTAVRADAGGWKLALNGTAATTAKDVPESAKLDLGYDGATAWSLREKEKVAFTESIRKDADVETFFRRNSAGPAVAWDVLGDKPMSMGGAATLDGEGKAGGEDCAIVKITGAKADGEQATTVRVFIAKKDNLPRRIERSREIKDTQGAPMTLSRVLELAELKTDSDVTAVPFALAAPDGFTIRSTPNSRRDAATPADALKGPGVKDKDNAPKPAGAMMGDGKRVAFPEFKLKDADGKEFTLDSYKGEVVIVDFWATWCGWCVKGMPDLQKLHNKYKDRKVKVVGINLFEEKPEDAVKFKKDKKYTYGLLLRGDDLGQKLKISGIPVLFVLDGEGKVIERIGGYDAKMFDRLSKIIDKELVDSKVKK